MISLAYDGGQMYGRLAFIISSPRQIEFFFRKASHGPRGCCSVCLPPLSVPIIDSAILEEPDEDVDKGNDALRMLFDKLWLSRDCLQRRHEHDNRAMGPLKGRKEERQRIRRELELWCKILAGTLSLSLSLSILSTKTFLIGSPEFGPGLVVLPMHHIYSIRVM